MHRVEFRDVEAVIEKQIKDGRIIGLKKWEGRTAKVVILNERPPYRERKPENDY